MKDKGKDMLQITEDILLQNREHELKNRFLLAENKRLEEKISKLISELLYLRRTLPTSGKATFREGTDRREAFCGTQAPGTQAPA